MLKKLQISPCFVCVCWFLAITNTIFFKKFVCQNFICNCVEWEKGYTHFVLEKSDGISIVLKVICLSASLSVLPSACLIVLVCVNVDAVLSLVLVNAR